MPGVGSPGPSDKMLIQAGKSTWRVESSWGADLRRGEVGGFMVPRNNL
jgi:hypothetical protein